MPGAGKEKSMTATKEQEMKALEKIRKIVGDLGEDSYLGAAFEGCFMMADSNIRNDELCSWKQNAELAWKSEREARKELEEAEGRTEAALRRAEAFDRTIGSLQDALSRMTEETCQLKARVAELEKGGRAEEAMRLEIMKLKAKLYDLVCA